MFERIELSLSAYFLYVEDEGRLVDGHLKDNFPHFAQKVSYPFVHGLLFVPNAQHLLHFGHHLGVELRRDALLCDLLPVGLVGLSQNVNDRAFELGVAYFLDHLLHWLEVLLNSIDNHWDRILEEISNSFMVEFGTQVIEEDILAVALVKL